jgi:hypothetical protein
MCLRHFMCQYIVHKYVTCFGKYIVKNVIIKLNSFEKTFVTMAQSDLCRSANAYSLWCNPLARSPGQVIRPSDKRNFIRIIGTSPNGQVNFLLLDLYLHDHQNVFSKEFNFIMTISNIFENSYLSEEFMSKSLSIILFI